jgi:hypothetical protein
MPEYMVKDLGRSKWSGKVFAHSKNPEHVEAAILREARKHLISNQIEVSLSEDGNEGNVIVGGFRIVGSFKCKD